MFGPGRQSRNRHQVFRAPASAEAEMMTHDATGLLTSRSYVRDDRVVLVEITPTRVRNAAAHPPAPDGQVARAVGNSSVFAMGIFGGGTPAWAWRPAINV